MPKQEDESIDRLFRPLMDHRSEPGAEVWGKIQASIKERKSKRRAIAFWCMGGLAAGSLLYVLSGPVAIKTGVYPGGSPEKSPEKNVVAKKAGVSNRVGKNAVTGLLEKSRPAEIPRVVKAAPLSGIARLFGFTERNAISIANSGKRMAIPERNEMSGVKTTAPEPGSAIAILPDVVHLNHQQAERKLPAISGKCGVDLLIRSRRAKQSTSWSVTPYFSQELAGYSLADHDGPSVNGHETEKKERNVFSASAGIYLNYQLRSQWIIQSGINYAWSRSILSPGPSFAVKNDAGNVQYKVSTTTGYGYFPHAGTTTISVGDSAMTDKVYSKLAYIGIPLTFNRAFYFGRIKLVAGGGASFNILTGSTIETRISETTEKTTSTETMHGLRKTNYGLIVKAEIHYAINPNCDLAVFPAFKSVLSPINMQTPQSVSPYNFGLGLGMTFRL